MGYLDYVDNLFEETNITSYYQNASIWTFLFLFQEVQGNKKQFITDVDKVKKFLSKYEWLISQAELLTWEIC